MNTPSARYTALLVAGGGSAVAVTTALEVLTSPYSPTVVAYPLNGAVHAAKVVAVLAVAVGLAAFSAQLRTRSERGAAVAAVAAGAVAVATVAGAAPYSVVEALLDPGLAPAAAAAELDATYDGQSWIPAASMVALPVLLLGVLVLAGVALRHRLVPTWAPLASLAAIPVAVLAGVLGELGWAVPHPPAWLFLGLSAYGVAHLRRPAPAVGAAALTSPRS